MNNEVDEISAEDLEAAGDVYDSYRKELEEKKANEKKLINTMIECCYGNCCGTTRRLGITESSGIHFTESGLSRLHCTIGWLSGLVQANVPGAEKTALDFLNAIRRYSLDKAKEPKMFTTVGTWDKFSYPKRVVSFSDVSFSDDGTLGGFNFAMFNLCEEQDGDAASDKRNTVIEIVGTKLVYHRIMYGGLLYHGNYGSNVLAVTLDNCSGWSYHT